VSSTIQELRREIRRIEAGGLACKRDAASLGAAIDARLPWSGLAFAGLHELQGMGAHGFAAGLASRLLAASQGHLIWCEEGGRTAAVPDLYGPGLDRFGIEHRRVVSVRASSRDRLWVLEEALRCPATAVIVADIDDLDLQASRRLQLASERGGGAGILIRRKPDAAHNAALTRWRLQTLADAGCRHDPSRSNRWRAELWRVRGGAPQSLEMVWDERTFSFAMVEGMADRAASPLCEKTGDADRSQSTARTAGP
jgi:protein ImuA